MGLLQAISQENPGALIFANGIITFAFVAYIFVALQHFSFDRAIAGVVPVKPIDALRNSTAAQTAEPQPHRASSGAQSLAESAEAAVPEEETSAFNRACAQVAEQFLLTARELDVLELLARGRTSPVIQERLVVSHNTVKSHVRHIYAKLGVHSQQELIDVIDRARNTSGK